MYSQPAPQNGAVASKHVTPPPRASVHDCIHVIWNRGSVHVCADVCMRISGLRSRRMELFPCAFILKGGGRRRGRRRKQVGWVILFVRLRHCPKGDVPDTAKYEPPLLYRERFQPVLRRPRHFWILKTFRGVCNSCTDPTPLLYAPPNQPLRNQHDCKDHLLARPGTEHVKLWVPEPPNHSIF